MIIDSREGFLKEIIERLQYEARRIQKTVPVIIRVGLWQIEQWLDRYEKTLDAAKTPRQQRSAANKRKSPGRRTKRRKSD